MTSMKDIAVMCGVSIATVSKALNDHRDISEATKEKISRITSYNVCYTKLLRRDF